MSRSRRSGADEFALEHPVPNFLRRPACESELERPSRRESSSVKPNSRQYEGATAKRMQKRPHSDQGPARDDGLLEQPARPPWKKTRREPNVLSQLQATFKSLSFHAKQFGPEKNINVQDVWRLMMSAPEVQAFNIETQKAYSMLWEVVQKDRGGRFKVLQAPDAYGLFEYMVESEFDDRNSSRREADIAWNYAARVCIRSILRVRRPYLMLNEIREANDIECKMACAEGPGDDWIRNLAMFPLVFGIGEEQQVDGAFERDWCITLRQFDQLMAAGVQRDIRLLTNTLVGLPEVGVVSMSEPSSPRVPFVPPPPPPPVRRESPPETEPAPWSGAHWQQDQGVFSSRQEQGPLTYRQGGLLSPFAPWNAGIP